MTDTSAAPSKSSTRRTVIRVGATAAWAVPAIQVATMVPAFAVSGAAVTVSSSSLTFSGNSLTGSITLSSGAKATSGITLSFSGLAVKVGTAGTYAAKTATAWATSASGWTSAGGGVFNHVTGLAPNSTTTLTFTITLPTGTGVPTSFADLNFGVVLGGTHETGTSGVFTDVRYATPALEYDAGTFTKTASKNYDILVKVTNAGANTSAPVTMTISNLYQAANWSVGPVSSTIWPSGYTSTNTKSASITSTRGLTAGESTTLVLHIVVGSASGTPAATLNAAIGAGQGLTNQPLPKP